MGPGALSDILGDLPKKEDPSLLVGFDTADDACVYRISDQLAMIQTADFFPPMVDDPYLFGQIAAANALSDVYAMGGQPRVALNLLCVNSCLGNQVVGEILRGGAEKALEAGCVISGGHTIEDEVPKYGLSVTGFIHPDRILRNTGAAPEDALVLTKALGVGILLTALKGEVLEHEDCGDLFASMIALNDKAAGALEGFSVHACTDITGFGLLGHLYEMASGSGVTARVQAASLPLLPGAAEMAREGLIPGGAYRNREYIKSHLRIDPAVPQHLADIACDPQTSGGLCVALPEKEAHALILRLQGEGVDARLIGAIAPPGESTLELLP